MECRGDQCDLRNNRCRENDPSGLICTISVSLEMQNAFIEAAEASRTLVFPQSAGLVNSERYLQRVGGTRSIHMSYPPPTHGGAEYQTPVFSSAGPPAHEDLTIAELLETMHVSEEQRADEECFLSSNGTKRWVARTEVQRFIRRLGAQHPSDYFASHQMSWENDFFSGY